MRCVPAHDFTVSKAVAWRSAIHDDPPYQRESSVWTADKQQLFIDSLLNGYDVPKIYLHDLRGQHPTQVYAVVDGRQRLTTIWRFLDDQLPLAADFRIEPANAPDLPVGTVQPAAGQRYSELDPRWQRVLRQTYLAVVLIQNATEEDIEELFSRLNNGEPLNDAEKRNALGGAVPDLVRELARHRFFQDRVRIANDRYQHQELAARFVLVEADASATDAVPDLRSRALTAFVRANRRMDDTRRRDVLSRVQRRLAILERIFGPRDALLARQGFVTLWYLFVRRVEAEAEADPERVRSFLEAFQQDRMAAIREMPDQRDASLVEFTHLMQHGTHEPRSLERRLAILLDAFTRVPVAGGA